MVFLGMNRLLASKTEKAMTPHNLPEPVETYITASNMFDIDGLMATFAADALVNDHRDEFDGSEAIRNWRNARSLTTASPCGSPPRPVVAAACR